MPPRVLLVEDDPVSREVLAALLAARGYEVDEEADGFGALRCAQERAHDLIFIDYHLPEMDGYALARLMRTLAERSGVAAKMVAITADSFGLAARRGADGVFDRIISKPIDPRTLYGFCDEVFPTPSLDIDAFLAEAERDAEPVPQDASPAAHAADLLWRAQGLPERPAVAVFPAPSQAEREALDHCFRLVGPSQADALLLLRQDGLVEVERYRADAALPAPLVVLDPSLEPVGDAMFRVGDGESWTVTAAAIERFRAGLTDLAATTDPDMRLCGHLHLAGRALCLRRGADGRASLPYTGGFAPAFLIAAAKRLTATGVLAARPATGEGVRELEIGLTDKGRQLVLTPEAIARGAGDRVA